MSNIFSADATVAETTQQQLRAEQAAQAADKKAALAKFNEQKAAAIRNSRLKRLLAQLRHDFPKSVQREFRKSSNPELHWKPARILAAGDYVVYLTQDHNPAQTYQAPAISEADAKLIQGKFVWGLLTADSKAIENVTIPDGFLVGQHEDWFLELLTTKQEEFKQYIARRDREEAQASAPAVLMYSSDGSEEEPTVDTDSQSVVDETEQAPALSSEQYQTLAAAFLVSKMAQGSRKGRASRNGGKPRKSTSPATSVAANEASSTTQVEPELATAS